jgi:hypothetical protein
MLQLLVYIYMCCVDVSDGNTVAVRGRQSGGRPRHMGCSAHGSTQIASCQLINT